MRVILLGPPGVGKGTQGVRIARHFGAPHISTGNMLREAVESGTELGMQAKSIMDRGDLVPDDVMIGVVRDRLAAPDTESGFVLDGFPRTVPQAEALGIMLDEMKMPLDAAIVIDAPVETIVERLGGRRVCPVCKTNYHVTGSPPREAGRCDEGHGALIQREDDREEVIRERLSLYAHKTAPLVNYYRQAGRLIPVAGAGAPEDVFGRLVEAVEARRYVEV